MLTARLLTVRSSFCTSLNMAVGGRGEGALNAVQGGSEAGSCRGPVKKEPSCEQNDRQTQLKTLPSRKLAMQAVKNCRLLTNVIHLSL